MDIVDYIKKNGAQILITSDPEKKLNFIRIDNNKKKIFCREDNSLDPPCYKITVLDANKEDYPKVLEGSDFQELFYRIKDACIELTLDVAGEEK